MPGLQEESSHLCLRDRWPTEKQSSHHRGRKHSRDAYRFGIPTRRRKHNQHRRDIDCITDADDTRHHEPRAGNSSSLAASPSASITPS